MTYQDPSDETFFFDSSEVAYPKAESKVVHPTPDHPLWITFDGEWILDNGEW